MKRIFTTQLTPGMVLAEDVLTYGNQLILTKGTILTEQAIAKFVFYSILSVRIEDSPAVPLNQDTLFVSYRSQIQSSNEFKQFKQVFEKSTENFQISINEIVKKNLPLDVNVLLSHVSDLFSTCDSCSDIFDMIHCIRNYDDSTYTHSINVALICMVFAKWLHFSRDDIELATLCGLLHDIGKILIPETIMKKPDKLDDDEFTIMKTHPKKGYDIIKDQGINDHIKNTILMHHEKCDGSGYPLGLRSNQIDRFAKLVTIADIYDATTSARIYRGPLCPFKVIALFESEGFQKFDPAYIMTFLKNVAGTYLHHDVLLSNGHRGKIIFINAQYLSKPIVQCKETFVDLAKEKDIYIEQLL